MFTGVEGGSKEVAVELHLRHFRALGTRMAASAIEGLPAKRAYIAFLADFFIFCRIKLIFGRLSCVDMKNIVP